MKKFNLYAFSRWEKRIKFDLKMKLTTFLFIVSLFQINANTYSQNKKITLKLNDVTVEEVLSKIESLSEFRFLYNSEEIKVDRKVSVNVIEKSISNILENLFLNSNIEYVVKNDQIVLKINDKLNSKIITSQVQQQIEIKGTVVDNYDMPLPGASIIIKGTSNGTTTDFDGNFTLMLSDNATTLIFSYVGFATQEIVINNQTTFNIKLIAEASALDEVVIIGYGSVSKKELTGSVATADNIEDRAVTKVEEALQGSVSGVTVLSNGGDPTSTPTIKIRGLGTSSGEKPLWILDGVPYYGGPINPFDIESITVLKDAASASIYGVRAAAGVILVTTKKGKQGDIKVNFGEYSGFQSVYNKPVALNAQQYTDMYNIAYDNSGSPRLDYFDGTKNPDRLVQRTNWVDKIFRNGIIQNYDIGLRGGSEKYSFSSSLGYNNKEGILINTYANRISFRYNSTFKLNDKIKVGENFSYTLTNGQSAFTGTQATNGETNYNGVIAAAIKAPPFVSVYNSNGTYSDVADGQNGDVLHPVGTLNRIDIHNPKRNTFGNIFL
jgi:TonB-dependent starch-binding outer membrane protein SusC